MALFRRGRLLYLVARQLGQKYTKALTLGFIFGLLLSLGFWRVYPTIRKLWFTPVVRTGLVGEFNPTTLPSSVQHLLSAGLTNVNAQGEVLPGLATSWTATDSGKTFIFTLRRDAAWHNTKPVVAQDVNYNIRNVTFSALDDSTLKASLQAPYGAFPSVVSKPLFLTGLTGWGQYQVGSIKLNGDKVTYLKLVPVADRSRRALEYRFYKTEASAITAYKLGEIDVLADVSDEADLPQFGGSLARETNYGRIVSLYFNLTTPFLSDKNIRQGLAFATPVREEVERAPSPISKTSWAYTDKVKKYTFDAAMAKKLLGNIEASGSAKLTISTFSPYLSDAQSIADSWTKFGVATDVKVVSSVPPDYQVLLSAQDLPPDPDQYPFWHSTQTDTNITHYVNVKIDKLLEDGRQELDPARRKTIYEDFQRRLVDDAPAVFLYYGTSYTVSRHP